MTTIHVSPLWVVSAVVENTDLFFPIGFMFGKPFDMLQLKIIDKLMMVT